MCTSAALIVDNLFVFPDKSALCTAHTFHSPNVFINIIASPADLAPKSSGRFHCSHLSLSSEGFQFFQFIVTRNSSPFSLMLSMAPLDCSPRLFDGSSHPLIQLRPLENRPFFFVQSASSVDTLPVREHP